MYYRFTVGPAPKSKYGAANGLISDVMDPRFGQDDPNWDGKWNYQSRLEPEKNLWLAMLTIPYTTIGVELPRAGTVWRGNVCRAISPPPARSSDRSGRPIRTRKASL